MTRSTYKLIVLLAFGWIICLPAYAVTLGQVQMQSGLGQPLSARIPVYDADDADIQSLTVQLASEDAFRRLGIDRNLYSDLQVRLQIDDSGRPYVELSTPGPFHEPVLNILIDASWRNGGRQVKEMTALIDPPFISKTAVQTIDAPTVALTPVVAAPTVAPITRTPAVPTGSEARPVPEVQKDRVPEPKAAEIPAPKPAPVRNVSAPTPAARPIPATRDNQREVQDGESLYTIAIAHKQTQTSTVSLNQMMTAIQRANPEAFIQGDANRLKRGSILRLPDEEQVRALLPDDSAGLLAGQWARKVQAQPAPVLGAANRLSRPAAAPAANSTGKATPLNQGRLKIVPTVGTMNNAGSQSGASKSGQGTELRAENSLSQEDLAARQVEIANLRNQLDEAAKLQTESKRLIELQNSQIKQLTERMQQLEKGGKPGNAATAAVPAAAPASDPWYFSPYAAFAALLLIAGLLGVLLRRKR
ncbi:MAG: type IV pilus assembly protein FimV [Arenimonas sp.]